jgi:hypothetical protein
LTVADEHEDGGVGLEVLLEPHAGLEVEMVGGLVEEKHGGLDEEGLGQGDTHAPTTAELARLLPLHLRREAETEEQLAGLHRRNVQVESLEAFVDLGERVALGAVIRHAEFLPEENEKSAMRL